MREGPVTIVLRVKEPMSHDVLWLRPRLHDEGYDLLYYGNHGWMPLITEPVPHHHHKKKPYRKPQLDMQAIDMFKNFIEAEPLVPRKEDTCSSQKTIIER